MGYKDILVYADATNAAVERLDLAARIAKDHGAHLTGLHVKSLPFVPADLGVGVPPMVVEWQQQAIDELAEGARRAVEAAVRRTGQGMETRIATGEIGSTTLTHGLYSDLIVLSQSADEISELSPADELPETVVMGSGRPALIVPRYGKFPNVGRRVVVAWNQTRESSRALHDALPFLSRAESVTVMEVNPKRGNDRIVGADIGAHLARLGIKVEVTSTVADDIEVGDAILSRLADLGADLLVMGAYGHSRLREYAFGGVTRHILKHMTVPVLMSH